MSLERIFEPLPTAEARSYWVLARTHTYSLTFALPLLVLYEASVALLNRGQSLQVRNAADWFVRGVLAGLGIRGTLMVTAVLIVVALALILHERRRQAVPVRRAVFAGMLAESTLLAAAFGLVVGRVTAAVVGGLAMSVAGQAGRLSLAEQLVLSLGAGLYEELVFRVLLVGALMALLTGLAALLGRRADRALVVALAVVGAALVFSAVHYTGPFADRLALGSFVFRFIGGLAFSVIYALRGFGIAAWTHALYDVLVVLVST